MRATSLGGNCNLSPKGFTDFFRKWTLVWLFEGFNEVSSNNFRNVKI